MDLLIRGSPTPRNYDRQVPGSARDRPVGGRPPSAKPTSVRNPITVCINGNSLVISKI